MPDPRLDADDPLNWDSQVATDDVDWPELESEITGRNNAPTFTWLMAWRLVLSKPTFSTFHTLLNDPNATLNRANAWLALAGAFSSVSPVLIATVTDANGTGVLAGFIGALCVAPFGVFGYMVVALLGMMTVHTSASALGGKAPFDKSAYALSLSLAPLTVIVSVIGLVLALIMTTSSSVAIFISFVAGLFAVLYQSILAILAVRTVYQIGWGESTVAALSPLFILYGCGCACLSLALASGNYSVI